MQQPVVRVGEWLVTPSINQISRNGRQLTLEPRLIDLLVFFAQHSGEVLSRDELIDNVWKRSIVTNHVVTQSISELRKSLKDNDEDSPVYIATVPKRGYKLMVLGYLVQRRRGRGNNAIFASPYTRGGSCHRFSLPQS